MIVLLKRDGRLPYLAGVFDDETAAQEFRDRIPPEVQKGIVAESFPEKCLPAYITEDERGFVVLTAEQALKDVRGRATPRRDDDWVYTNLYRIDEPFVPIVPGRDEMGRLPHWHIDNWHLDAINRGGLAALD